ncbi:MAG: SRPBCC family protein [Dehalococcoidia bacterium]|jgi:uncharacterized membrane protein|nr:SRPBCC family protein [Dehalococcoidia bacterium]
MPVITKSIIINVPVTMAYNQWTQFEEFPHFMEGIVEVTQIDDTTLHWVAEIGGRREEWEARITEQLPDEKIAWRSESGAMNSGVVTFQPINASQTKISLEIEYNPSGVVETVGDMMGYVSRQVEANLRRFKEFIESRDRESGAWRGKVA